MILSWILYMYISYNSHNPMAQVLSMLLPRLRGTMRLLHIDLLSLPESNPLTSL